MFVYALIDGTYLQGILLTREETISHINTLNADSSIFIHMWYEGKETPSRLTVIAGNNTRRLVVAHDLLNEDGIPAEGRLVDPTKTAYDLRTQFLDDDFRNFTSFPTRQTVSIETATRVAQFYVENGRVPNDTIWEMPVDPPRDFTEED